MNETASAAADNVLFAPLPAVVSESSIELKMIDSVYAILDRRFKQLVKVVLDEVEAGGENVKIKQKIWDIKDLLANDFLSLSVHRIKNKLNNE